MYVCMYVYIYIYIYICISHLILRPAAGLAHSAGDVRLDGFKQHLSCCDSAIRSKYYYYYYYYYCYCYYYYYYYYYYNDNHDNDNNDSGVHKGG